MKKAKKTKKAKKIKLIPPDLKRCQRTVLKGCHPTGEHFMAIGPGTMEQCKRKPVAIVYETQPGADGQKGSMSLCRTCLDECLERFPKGHLRVDYIQTHYERI